jgi:hypothetical protein
MQDHHLCHNSVTPVHQEFMFVVRFLCLNRKHFSILEVEELEPWYPVLSLSANVIFFFSVINCPLS